MVVWTKRSECKKSGLDPDCSLTDVTENNMRGLIDLAIAETNTAYNLSGVTTQLRLVHAYREPNYVEAATDAFVTALQNIQSSSDGVMDDLHEKRDVYGADIVAMIIDGAQYCGMAYLGPGIDLMFSVSSWNCATGYYTFGHEISHNFVSLLVILRLKSEADPAHSTFNSHMFQISSYRRDAITTRGLQILVAPAIPITAGVIPALDSVPFSHTIVSQVSVTICRPPPDVLEYSASRTMSTCTTARPWAVPCMIMRARSTV